MSTAPPAERAPSTAVIEVDDVIAGYVPEVNILNGCSLEVRQGEFVGIIGPNGAGKTTFLNLLSGELPPSAGKLHFQDAEVTHWSPDRRARAGMGRSFQHSSVFEDLPTFENARLAAQTRLASSFRFIHPASRYDAVVVGAGIGGLVAADALVDASRQHAYRTGSGARRGGRHSRVPSALRRIDGALRPVRHRVHATGDG